MPTTLEQMVMPTTRPAAPAPAAKLAPVAAAQPDAEYARSLTNRLDDAATNRAAERANVTEAQAQIAMRRQAATLGDLVAVFMRSKRYRNQPLQDVERMLVPALRTGQFSMAKAKNRVAGAPVGAVLWASVSDEVDRRLTQSVAEPIKLAPQEWRSGPHVWLVEAVGDAQVLGGLVRQVGDQVVRRPLKMRTRNERGQYVVRTLQPRPQAAAA
jgi:hemolysin-activating ACP:hemolysin acyltransferase